MAETRLAGRFRKVLAACRARGVTVVEEPGCHSRTVGTKDLVTVTSDVVHHTAGGNNASDRRVVRDGRPGLRGPLAQALTETDGTLRWLASGYANHAGSTLNPSRVGNSRSVGNEIVSAGLSRRDFTDAQMRTARILSEELAREFGYESRWTRGHKEEGVPLGRKVDPAFSMPDFRAALGAGSTTPTPTPSERTWLDMATEDEVRAIVREEVRAEANGALEAHLRDVLGALARAQRVDADQTGKLDRLVEQTRFTDDRIAVGFREQAIARLSEDRVRRVVTEVVGAVPTATADELVRRLVALLGQPAPGEQLPAAPAAETPSLGDKGPAAVTR